MDKTNNNIEAERMKYTQALSEWFCSNVEHHIVKAVKRLKEVEKLAHHSGEK